MPKNKYEMEALDLDELAYVSGGISANNNTVEKDGTVTESIGVGLFTIDVEGQIVTAKLSGQMRMNFIKVYVGDRVRVEYSQDTMKGRITHRYRASSI